MNDVCLRGVTHGSTYSAVGRPRPEDVNPDLPASLHVGRLRAQYSVTARELLRVIALGVTMFCLSTCSSPQSVLVSDERLAS